MSSLSVMTDEITERSCAQCGTPAREDARFCHLCGATDFVGEPEQLGRLKRATEGKYEIVGLYALTGLHEIYAATDLSCLRPVEIRVLQQAIQHKPRSLVEMFARRSWWDR